MGPGSSSTSSAVATATTTRGAAVTVCRGTAPGGPTASCGPCTGPREDTKGRRLIVPRSNLIHSSGAVEGRPP